MQQRPFSHDEQAQVTSLLLTYRAAGYVQRYPTVWRVRLLLASRVWDRERDTRLWEDKSGKIWGCAFLWKRRSDSPYYGLERIIHPDAVEISQATLAWATARAAEEAFQRNSTISVAAIPLEKDTIQDIRILEENGFSQSSEGYNVYMSARLDSTPQNSHIPEGFQLDALKEADLEQYQSTYGFTAVNIEHQRELLHNPEYQHWIIKAPDGSFAAYLECSFSREEWERSGQRVGWIDYVQTQSEFQRLGLAEALMLKGFEQLKIHGTERVLLITRHDNDSAQALFKTVGMDFLENEYVYFRNFGG
jgi:ribosomal protein S18 acetylase RimI-like enzyme